MQQSPAVHFPRRLRAAPWAAARTPRRPRPPAPSAEAAAGSLADASAALIHCYVMGHPAAADAGEERRVIAAERQRTSARQRSPKGFCGAAILAKSTALTPAYSLSGKNYAFAPGGNAAARTGA